MLYSRSCELFSSLCFLQFGESLGTASNKQWDLMMNSGKLRKTTQNELRETKFQWCLSCTVWYKENKENNKLRKVQKQINYCRRIFFVWVPPLFVHFEADFDCISDSDDIWRLCKYEHTPWLSEHTLERKKRQLPFQCLSEGKYIGRQRRNLLTIKIPTLL